MTKRKLAKVVATAVITMACEAKQSNGTDAASSDAGPIAADTEDCDLGDYACPIGFPCISRVRIGDGNCVDLPPGEGLRLEGDPDCVLGMLRDGTMGNFFVDHCPASAPPSVDYVRVLGDGTAVLARAHAASQSPTNEWGYAEPERRLIVKPPEFFDACIGSQDLAVVWHCLTEWYEPALCMPEACCPVDNEVGHPPC